MHCKRACMLADGQRFLVGLGYGHKITNGAVILLLEAWWLPKLTDNYQMKWPIYKM